MFKQHRLPFIGGLKDVLAHTAFWISIVNFSLIGVTAYNTTLRAYLIEYTPWLKIWMFLGVLVVIVGVMMFLEYKFIMPSYYSFRERQYTNDSDIRKLLVEVLKKLDEGVKNEDRNNSTS